MTRRCVCQHLLVLVRFTPCLLLVTLVTVFANGAAANDLGSRWARMWEYEEYSLTNTTWSGNLPSTRNAIRITGGDAGRTQSPTLTG